jgi:hypothetical protein
MPHDYGTEWWDVVLLCLPSSRHLTDSEVGFWSWLRVLVGHEARLGQSLRPGLDQGSPSVGNPYVLAKPPSLEQ